MRAHPRFTFLFAVTAHSVLPLQPKSPWNIALVLDPLDPDTTLTFEQLRRPGKQPYAESTIPVIIHGTGRILPSWGLFNNSAAPPPASPVDCTPTGSCGVPVPVTLVPYGSTLLRMAALPWTHPPPE
jgi:hypothetical protein